MKAKPWGTVQTSQGTRARASTDDPTCLPLVLRPPAHLGLASGLVLSQVDAGDGAEGPEELLQVCFTGVLGQVGDTDGGVVVSCANGRSAVRRRPCPTPTQWPRDNYRVPGGVLTSAVGLHGLPAAAGPVPQAWRHVLPRLALGGLHRLQLCTPKDGHSVLSPCSGAH
jgi:hypothetical protein